MGLFDEWKKEEDKIADDLYGIEPERREDYLLHVYGRRKEEFPWIDFGEEDEEASDEDFDEDEDIDDDFDENDDFDDDDGDDFDDDDDFGDSDDDLW